MIRFLPILAFIFLWITEGVAQQEGQYSLYMFNNLAINPGSAGSKEGHSFTLIHRSQWVGFKGAPMHQSLMYHGPFLSKRMAVGFTLSNRRTGILETQSGSFAMAYSVIRIKDLSVRIGLQGSVKRFSIKPENDEQAYILTGTRIAANDIVAQYLGNFGAGVFMTYKDCYVGFSVPFVYSNVIGINKTSPLTAMERPHIYLTGGLAIPLWNDFYLKPSGIIKKVENAPWGIELNTSLTFNDKVTTGVGYRAGSSNLRTEGESFSMLVFYQLNPQLGIGGAYDVNLLPFSPNIAGSFEFVARYDVQKAKIKLTNPRLFF